MSAGLPTYKPTVSGIKPPENYVETPLYDPFEAELGPFFRKIGNESAPKDGNPVELALFFDKRHRAADDLAAAGAMMTAADATMGWVAVFLLGLDAPATTLRLNADILQRPAVDQYMYCRTGLVERVGSTMAVEGRYFDARGALVMRATSLWKILGQ